MKLPDYLIEKGITEKEVLSVNSNTYTPGFMQIHLTVPFNGIFKDMVDVHHQGSFLHEYVHFLQNLTTPWGLYTSMVQYSVLVDTYAYIQRETDIKIPLIIDFDEKKREVMEIIRVGNGHNPFNCLIGSRHINRTIPIVWHRKLKKIGDKQYPYLVLDVPCDDAIKSIEFGAYMIKESMAAMYQMQFDPTATHDDNDLPYNIVKIIAEQSYPNIASDEKKLIAICYLSLFSLSPAEVLFEQLDYANTNPQLSGIELLERFVNESQICVNDNDYINVVDFYDDISRRFETVLQKNLQEELDYIHEAMTRSRLSNGIIPIISILYDTDMEEDDIQNLINFIGLPYIYTDYDEYHYPRSVKNENSASSDIIELIGSHALYNYLVHPNSLRCCPLRYMCKHSSFVKEECFDRPWLGQECIMTIMGSRLDLKSKNISWE